MSLDALATASLERYTDEIKANKPKIVIERPLQIKRSYSNNNPNHLPFIRKTQSDIGSFG